MPPSSPDSEEAYGRYMIDEVENVYCKSHEFCHIKYCDPASEKLSD